jgi:predicted Zn-dependent peptidase
MGHSLQVVSQVPESERLARELVPLLGNPQALDEAWNEAVEQVTAEEAQRVVEAYKGATATKKESVKSSLDLS